MSAPPLFSVIVPSRGAASRLATFLPTLKKQTLAAERFETILVLDGAAEPETLREALPNLQVVPLPVRGGPGAARNRGAELAKGTFLALTEDDVHLDPAWLANATQHLEKHPEIDVLDGTTVKPGGRPVHRTSGDLPRYLPTNLFIRRELFLQIGGYDPRFFDAKSGLYFREDSDLGFRLEKAGAHVHRADDVVVTHPEEHETYLGPLLWARRHVMDPLLHRKHPKLFRNRIEVFQFGPIRIRRPIPRASVAVTLLATSSLVAATLGAGKLAGLNGALAGCALFPLWAKWRWDPRRLPIVTLVPFVLTAALAQGWFRARRLKREERKSSSDDQGGPTGGAPLCQE